MILRIVPRPLAILLVCVAICGVAWTLLVPPWGGPDEDAHFAYSQTLAELGRLPGGAGESVSSEQRQLMISTNTDATVFFSYAKPEWSRVGEREWRKATASQLATNGGGGSAAASYPPAYYMVEALAYEAVGGKDIATRLYVMRMVSVLWLLVATVAAWLLAGEVFRRRRPLQLVTAAAVGLWPMMCFVTGILNPDAMFIGLSALATWLCVSLVRGQATAPRVIGLCLCVGIALVTKATALALLPPAVVALAIAAWHARGGVRVRRLAVRGAVVAVVAAVAFALPVVAWSNKAHELGRSAYGQTALVTSTSPGSSGASAPQKPDGRGSLRHFVSYLWQFYLPRLPGQDQTKFIFPITSNYPAFQVWLASGWASFGWVNVWFGRWVYWIFFWVVMLALAGLAVVGVRWLRRRRASSERPARPRGAFAAPLVMALFALTLLAGLHRTDFRMYLDGGAPFLQGRYILPLAPLFGLLLAQSTRALPRRFRPALQGGVLAALVVFQLACLGLIAWRYYAA